MRSLGKTIPGGKDSPPAEVPSIGTEFKGMATSSSSSRREEKAPEKRLIWIGFFLRYEST